MTKSRGINKPKAVWSEEQIEAVRLRYPHEKTETIASDIGMSLELVYRKADRLGLSKTPEYMASPDACRLRRDNPKSVAHRFPKGHVPANKGLRRPGYTAGRMAETQFKKGSLSGRAAKVIKPIGAERISKDGYLERKINNDLPFQKRWRAVHILEWEKVNGSLPKGFAITFKDGDKNNRAYANLELVSRADLMRRNTIHNYPKEIAQVVQLRGAVNRKINRRLKNERNRTAGE